MLEIPVADRIFDSSGEAQQVAVKCSHCGRVIEITPTINPDRVSAKCPCGTRFTFAQLEQERWAYTPAHVAPNKDNSRSSMMAGNERLLDEQGFFQEIAWACGECGTIQRAAPTALPDAVTCRCHACSAKHVIARREAGHWVWLFHLRQPHPTP